MSKSIKITNSSNQGSIHSYIQNNLNRSTQKLDNGLTGISRDFTDKNKKDSKPTQINTTLNSINEIKKQTQNSQSKDIKLLSPKTKNDIYHMRLMKNITNTMNKTLNTSNNNLNNSKIINKTKNSIAEDKFEDTIKNEIKVTKSMLLNQELKSILHKKHLSQCNSPKRESILIKENELEIDVTPGRTVKTPIYQYNKRTNEIRNNIKQNKNALNSITNELKHNSSNITLESKNSGINFHFNDEGVHNINIQNIIAASDDTFYKDIRFLKLKDDYNKLFEEKNRLNDSVNELNRVIDIMGNYIKTQQKHINEIRIPKQVIESKVTKVLFDENKNLKLTILKMLHQIQLFENNEVSREKEINKCYSQILCENEFLRKISENVVGSRVNELHKKHNRTDTRINNLINTVNNSLIDEKQEEELTIKDEDLLKLTLGQMNSTMKKNTNKNKIEEDLFSTKLGIKKYKTNICYMKKNK